ncbi:uncharacterized protein V1518DRAFT_451757 [Limtongia smithiae]|uniref:uncharacterized protein n=1 Tax=Limtongia smithiae TaxID=1125753 RepID=UPI0034CFB6CB
MLTDKVLALLSEDSTHTLSEVSTAVLATLSDPDQDAFYLLCDILVMLEALRNTAPDDDDDDGVDADAQARCRIAKALNGEFMLYTLYERYESIEMNPFLSHFVTTYAEGKILWANRPGAVDEMQASPQLLPLMQASLLSLFLVGAGHIVGELRAIDFYSVWHELMRDDIDTDRFTDALVNQGMVDPPPASKAMAEIAERSSPTDRNTARTYEVVRRLLQLALTEEISDKDTDALVSVLAGDSHLLVSSFDLSDETITTMLHVNPVLGRSLISVLLLTPLRAEVLHILQLLPPTLPVLESLNHLISPPHVALSGRTDVPVLHENEKSVLLHSFISHASRIIESQEVSTASSAMSSARETPLHNFPPEAIRQIQLLCLFIQSLLRTGAIAVEDYVYEIQGMSLRFVFVQEATELFHVAQRALAARQQPMVMNAAAASAAATAVAVGATQQQQQQQQQQQRQRVIGVSVL